MNKKDTIEWVRDIIGSSMFWKDDSPYTIKDVATSIVEFIEVHPIAENNLDKLFAKCPFCGGEPTSDHNCEGLRKAVAELDQKESPKIIVDTDDYKLGVIITKDGTTHYKVISKGKAATPGMFVYGLTVVDEQTENKK